MCLRVERKVVTARAQRIRAWVSLALHSAADRPCVMLYNVWVEEFSSAQRFFNAPTLCIRHVMKSCVRIVDKSSLQSTSEMSIDCNNATM